MRSKYQLMQNAVRFWLQIFVSWDTPIKSCTSSLYRHLSVLPSTSWSHRKNYNRVVVNHSVVLTKIDPCNFDRVCILDLDNTLIKMTRNRRQSPYVYERVQVVVSGRLSNGRISVSSTVQETQIRSCRVCRANRNTRSNILVLYGYDWRARKQRWRIGHVKSLVNWRDHEVRSRRSERQEEYKLYDTRMRDDVISLVRHGRTNDGWTSVVGNDKIRQDKFSRTKFE